MPRGVLLLVLWLLPLLACGEPAHPPVAADGWGPSAGLGAPAVSEDPVRPPVPRPKAIPAPERLRWPRADELDTLTPIGGRGPSEHLDGSYERSVVVNEAAAAYAHLVAHRTLPVGALIAQRHHRHDSQAIVSWYVMEKVAPETWRYLVLDPERRIAAKANLDACARCHVEAPHDGLFGPPTDTQLSDVPGPP